MIHRIRTFSVLKPIAAITAHNAVKNQHKQ